MAKFEKHITVVFSTAHISQEDAKLLENGKTGVVAYEFEYGFFVYLSEDETEAALKESGFSMSFIRVYFDARDTGAKYLQLDADGTVYDDYKKFDW